MGRGSKLLRHVLHREGKNSAEKYCKSDAPEARASAESGPCLEQKSEGKAEQSHHEDLDDCKADRVLISGKMFNGKDMAGEEKRAQQREGIPGADAETVLQREKGHPGDADDRSCKRNEPGKLFFQGPRQKWHEDDIGCGEKGLLSRGGVIQPKRLGREAEKKKEPDYHPGPDSCTAYGSHSPAENGCHKQCSRTEAENEQPERGVAVEGVFHGDESNAPEEGDHGKGNICEYCFHS